MVGGLPSGSAPHFMSRVVYGPQEPKRCHLLPPVPGLGEACLSNNKASDGDLCLYGAVCSTGNARVPLFCCPAFSFLYRPVPSVYHWIGGGSGVEQSPHPSPPHPISSGALKEHRVGACQQTESV